jgi:hypothetical protein
VESKPTQPITARMMLVSVIVKFVYDCEEVVDVDVVRVSVLTTSSNPEHSVQSVFDGLKIQRFHLCTYEYC